ncbi:TPA: Bro-N domain-containing protein [Pseudomonas aeruginosa]
MQTAQVIPFEFEANKVRTAVIDGQPWFAAKDVISALEYAKSSAPAKLIDHVPTQWKGVNRIHTPGGTQRLLMLSEQGLYFFLGRSDKEKALPFQIWLAGEVLPSIRRTGRYEDSQNKMATLVGETIGTDGFHMLGALIKGKVATLPVEIRRRATMKIWSQTHAAFGVRSASDIPANQLDAARNFVAAYSVHEGEWLPKPEKRCGTLLNDHQLYDVHFVCHHFQYLYEIFKRHSLYSFLGRHGSRAGIEMIDHFKDGSMGVWKLRKDFDGEFDAVQRRLKLNRYSDFSIR